MRLGALKGVPLLCLRRCWFPTSSARLNDLSEHLHTVAIVIMGILQLLLNVLQIASGNVKVPCYKKL